MRSGFSRKNVCHAAGSVWCWLEISDRAYKPDWPWGILKAEPLKSSLLGWTSVLLFCWGLLSPEQVAPQLKVEFFSFFRLSLGWTSESQKVCARFFFFLIWKNKHIKQENNTITVFIFRHICLKKIFFSFLKLWILTLWGFFTPGKRFMTGNAWNTPRTMCIIFKNDLTSIWVWKCFIPRCCNNMFLFCPLTT